MHACIAGLGPPQFADDAGRLNSKAAGTPGPDRWSPANEETFFKDTFKGITLESLIKSVARHFFLRRLVEVPEPRDANPEALLYFERLWEATYQLGLITMFGAPGTVSLLFNRNSWCYSIYGGDPLYICLRMRVYIPIYMDGCNKYLLM